MGKIVLLDELTINQIAAGEVIERPASVIKEMVENSIDAGATKISVEIKNGGISYIRISDNGKGIARDDVEMAFERHATSKIRSAKDLQQVRTMGFRGEALASIAAISNVELISKTQDEEVGTKIVVEGGKIIENSEVGCSTGTVITVRNLFYNTPVRYKFLKKDFTETGYIEDVIKRIALIHPEISIRLTNLDKTVIQTNGNGNLKTVIYSIYGKDIATNSIPIYYEYNDIKVTGVVGKPEIARSNRSNQVFFINKRYIKNKTLTAGAEQAFKGMLPTGKFGFLILNIQMDPSNVDVNVHPAKLEVRFENESDVFKAVYHAIKNALSKENLMANQENNNKDFEHINNINENNEEKNNITLENTISENKTDNIMKISDDSETHNKNSIEEKERTAEDMLKELINIRNELKEQLESGTNKKFKIENKSKDTEIIEKKDEDSIKTEQIDNKETSEIYSKDESEKIGNKEISEIYSKDESEEINEKQIEKIYDDNTIKLEEIHNKENEIINNNELIKEDNINQDNVLMVETSVENAENNLDNTQNIENKEEQIDDYDELSFEAIYKKLFGKEPYGGKKFSKPEIKEDKYRISTDELSDNLSVFDNIEEYGKPIYKFIGIAFKKYIIIEMNSEIYIMDQYAVQERIIFERLKENFYSKENTECQILLLPDVITLTQKQMIVAKENFKVFEQAGFMVEEFGENTLKISGVPEVCINLEPKVLFAEILDKLNTVARTDIHEKENVLLKTIAQICAQSLSLVYLEDDVVTLIEELLRFENPFSATDGSTVVIKMSKYDIERKFARK